MSKRIKNVRWINGMAHGRKVYRGIEHIKSLETADARVAAQRVKAWVDELRATGWQTKGKTTFEEAIKLAKVHHWPNLAPGTRVRYETSLVQMAELLEGRTIQTLNTADLMNYIAKRRVEGTSAPTIRRDLQALSVIYEVAMDAELTDVNTAKIVLKRAAKRGLKESAPRPRIATYAESAELVAGALQMPQRTEHTRTMLAAYIIVCTETGLRGDELLQMRWRWIDLDRRKELFVPKELAKRNKERTVPIRKMAEETLRRLREAKPCPSGEDYLFWSERSLEPYHTLWHEFQDAARFAGIQKHITIHDLRRTCGARLLRDGASMEVVSAWLGHGSVKVTERHYAFLNVDSLHRAVGTLQIEESRPTISLSFLDKNSDTLVQIGA